MQRLAAVLVTSFAALPVLAHDGHGALMQAHWHATDTFGLLLVGVLAGIAIWFGRK